MKLISLNIEGDKHLDDKILPFFDKEKPDVLCLQEVFAKDIQKICQRTGLEKYFDGLFEPVIELKEF